MQLLVLFGSQTGNAQDVAERVAREAKRRHFAPCVMAMDAYSVAALPAEGLVIFVASTTGQGELPDNMKHFWRFLLRKSLPPDSLASTTYAVFGLGDSGYAHYNVAAKKLDRRLAALGARAALERGLGDDQAPAGYEAVLDAWLPRLWVALRTAAPLPPGLSDPAEGDAATELVPRYTVTFLPRSKGRDLGPAAAPSATAPVSSGRAAAELAEAAEAARAFAAVEAAATGVPRFPGDDLPACSHGPWRPFVAPLLANERLTAAGHEQDTRLLSLGLRGSGLAYASGDLAAILPAQACILLRARVQAPAEVSALLARLGLSEDDVVRVEVNGCAPGGAAAEVRLGALVAGVLDVAGGSPRRFFFEVLARFASEPREAERLAYLFSPGGRDDLARYNQREGRTLLEVLRDFPGAAPPLAWLLQVGPRLQPRRFSIASSLSAHPDQAHVLAAVVEYRTPHKRLKRGVATGWLGRLLPHPTLPQVPVWVERGVLRLPPHQVPLVLVGPGTGVAPFRAFLQERAAAAAAGEAVAPSLLFFGCRREAADFYFRDEWPALAAAGALAPDGLVTAFSRDQPAKVYVGQRIREHGARVWALLQQGAVVFVSGAAQRMPQDVAAAFQAVATEHGGLAPADAARYVRQLALLQRYFVEAWS
ncbi:hypothetical protein WJX81_005476 [Elliptochloris bilobata]|uniref:NADPH-dependent diflavin oxidoreductase 1 n=1 Tax=Elliptochloris bilobata TaxID=381761 RepID=A0AAW1S0Q4_9CHLO